MSDDHSDGTGRVVGYEMWVECPNCGHRTEAGEVSAEEPVVCGSGGITNDQGCGAELVAEVRPLEEDTNGGDSNE